MQHLWLRSEYVRLWPEIEELKSLGLVFKRNPRDSLDPVFSLVGCADMRLFQEEDGDPELYQMTKYEYDRETFVPRIYDFRELLSRQTDMLLGDL